MPGRAVVPLQPDNARTFEIRVEAKDVVDLGAPPAIDRLVVVADAADIAVPLGEQPEPEILGDVGVLIFVDLHEAKALLVLRQHVGMLLEQP